MTPGTSMKSALKSGSQRRCSDSGMTQKLKSARSVAMTMMVNGMIALHAAAELWPRW